MIGLWYGDIEIEQLKNITESQGGLLLSKNDRTDIRYIEAEVISVGHEVEGVKEKDIIFYDRHNGHYMELENITYQVIKLQDVVVVL